MSVNNSRRDRLKAKQLADGNKKRGGGFSVLDTSGLDDIEFLRIEPNEEYILDVLPYAVTTKKHPEYAQMKKDAFLEDYKLEIPVHRMIGPSKTNIVCPKAYGRNCPICDEHDKALAETKERYKSEGKDEKKAYYDDDVKNLRASRRFFMVVIDKTDKSKMKIWEYSAAWALDNLIKRANRKNVLIGDLVFEDKSIVFTPDESQFDAKKPGECKTFDFESEGKYDFTEEDIVDVPKLDAMLKTHTNEEIENILWGNVDDDDSDDKDKTPETPPEKEAPVERSPRARRETSPEPDSEDTAEASEETPREKRQRERKEREAEEAMTPTCPVEGIAFGVDIDSDNACEDCGLYKECDKAYTESQKK